MFSFGGIFMKKILTALMSVLMILTLTACGGSEEKNLQQLKPQLPPHLPQPRKNF